MHLLKYLLLCLTIAAPTLGADLTSLKDGGIHKVVSVVDGDTVILNNGRQVRLVGIQAPKLPLGRTNFKAWPLALEAKAFLEDLSLSQDVQVRLGDHPEDRHGRILGHLIRVSDGLWIQGELLKAGLARVYTFADNRKLGSEMLALERQARADQKGLWTLPFYAIRTADNARHDFGTFQLVEDRIVDVAKVKKRIYLNFGPDWRTDFTVQIDARKAKLWRAQGLDLLTLKGKRVRVRGWIKEKNGPLIALDHPERLELISP
ncbi:MAG: nuclease (SNase) [Rhodospirillaceae bacterium]|nr:MAG: nuclease (SNase) [Rhodospirillaceae bacterium]